MIFSKLTWTRKWLTETAHPIFFLQKYDSAGVVSVSNSMLSHFKLLRLWHNMQKDLLITKLNVKNLLLLILRFTTLYTAWWSSKKGSHFTDFQRYCCMRNIHTGKTNLFRFIEKRLNDGIIAFQSFWTKRHSVVILYKRLKDENDLRSFNRKGLLEEICFGQ